MHAISSFLVATFQKLKWTHISQYNNDILSSVKTEAVALGNLVLEHSQKRQQCTEMTIL